MLLLTRGTVDTDLSTVATRAIVRVAHVNLALQHDICVEKPKTTKYSISVAKKKGTCVK